MSGQLWELLIKLETSEADDTLTCSECFAVLELLAVAVDLGLEIERLERLLRNHLAHCPGCRDQIAKRLEELENILLRD